MDIHLDLKPGEKCWVMEKNRPVQLVVEKISINVGLDLSRKNVVVDAIYHCSIGAIGGEYKREDLCKTKDELKEKIFG